MRLNEINSIPDPDVVNEVDARFLLGDGSVVTTGHKIDFTIEWISAGGRLLAVATLHCGPTTVNEHSPIVIGSLTYVGSEIRIAPGGSIPSRCIVGIGSVITGELSGEEQLIAGVPAKVLKELSEEDKFLIERKTRLDLPDNI